MVLEEKVFSIVTETVVGRTREEYRKFGLKATGYIGKHIVGTGEDAHLTTKVLIDLLKPHVILCSGKRGCVTGDTLIFTNNGFKAIKEFNSLKEKIYSYNLETGIFEWKNATLLSYPVNEKLIEIELQDGRKLTMTNEHPLLTFENDSIKWKKAEEMKIDDQIIVNLKVPEVKNDKESIRMARLLGFILAHGNIYVRKGKWKDGRGYWYNGTKKTLRIFSANENIIKQAKKDLEKEFGIKVAVEKRKSKGKILHIIQSKVIDKFIDLGVPSGRKAGKIRVPKIVWESSNKFKVNFLRALISCDGFVSKRGYVTYYSKSRKFLEDLQLLLSHFNVLSTIRSKIVKLNNKQFKNYALFITDQFSMLNLKKMGLIHDGKNERLQNYKPGKKHKVKQNVKLFTEEFCCLKIKKIRKIKKTNRVYDLNVPKTHSFLANGIVSHNSGKSYSASVILEEFFQLEEEFRKKLAFVVVDPMGIYWSMKFPNEQQLTLLKEWELEPKGFKDFVRVYVPAQQKEAYEAAGIPIDGTISIALKEFSAEDLILAFGLKRTEEIAIALEKNFNKILASGKSFGFEELIEEVRNDKETRIEIKNALVSLLEVMRQWGLVVKEGIRIEDLVEAGKATIIDLSRLASTELRSLLTALIARKIYHRRVLARKEEERVKIEGGKPGITFPVTWLVLEEAHNFIPSDREVASSDAIKRLAKEGREPGIGLFVITQMPNKVHQDVVSQVDIVISFRLTSKDDLIALRAVYQSYMQEEIEKFINRLPRWPGSAILIDDNLEKVFTVQIRPRVSHHAGATAAIV